MAIPKNSKRSGGPRTPAGKRAVSGNAFKHGLATGRWCDPAEDEHYQAVVDELLEQFPDPQPTAKILMDRLAVTCVQLGRLESIDNAQHQMARLLAEEVNPLLLQSPAAEPEGEQTAPSPAVLALRRATAMPSPERMQCLDRYRTNLDNKVIRLIKQLTD